MVAVRQSTDVGADRRADTVTIFDAAGANVKSYGQVEYDLDTFEGAWDAIGQCPGGLCLATHVGNDIRVSIVDTDGTALTAATVKGTEDDLFRKIAVAGAASNVFVAVSDGDALDVFAVGP